MRPANEQSSDIYVLSGTVRDFSCDPWMTCPTCEGGQQCTQCHGAGKTTCGRCNGRGYQTCPTCEGRESCPHCNGNRYFRCGTCHGSGVVPDGPGAVKTCYHCHGDGVVECDFCHATGHCPTCEGHGDITCSKCGGSGSKTCSSCGGDGRCATCSGVGSLMCKRCQGTGKYQTYTAYQATSYSKYKSIRPTLISSIGPNDVGGQVIYSGTTCEWSNGENMQFSKGRQVQADCLKQMSSAEKDQFTRQLQMMDEAVIFDLKPNNSADRPWKTNLEVKRIPVTTVRFTVDNKSYAVRFVGQGSNMVAETITPLPQEIESLKMTSADDRHMRNASPKKRARAFVLLGRYIAHNLYEDEWKSKNNMQKHITAYYGSDGRALDKLDKYVRERFWITQYRLLEEIEPLLHSKKTLAFIWQCIAIDHQPNERGMDLLHSVAKAMNLGEQDIKATKSMAIGFSKLSGEEAAKEYVEPDRDTRGERACIWTFLLIVAGIIFGIVYGAKSAINYYHNDFLPKRALTHHRTCNNLAQEALDNNDFKKAHYYLTSYCKNRTREGKNAWRVTETVVHFVDKALHTATIGNKPNDSLVPLAVDVFLAFNKSTHKTSQSECDQMRLKLVKYFLDRGDLLSANKVMLNADLESQFYFTDKALAYCMKAGEKQLANQYYASVMKFMRESMPRTDLSPYEKRWKKIMKETKVEKDFQKDPKVIILLKKKAPKNGKFHRWVE